MFILSIANEIVSGFKILKAARRTPHYIRLTVVQ